MANPVTDIELHAIRENPSTHCTATWIEGLVAKIDELRAQCNDKNHKGLDLIVRGAVKDPKELGRDAAAVWRVMEHLNNELTKKQFNKATALVEEMKELAEKYPRFIEYASGLESDLRMLAEILNMIYAKIQMEMQLDQMIPKARAMISSKYEKLLKTMACKGCGQPATKQLVVQGRAIPVCEACAEKIQNTTKASVPPSDGQPPAEPPKSS